MTRLLNGKLTVQFARSWRAQSLTAAVESEESVRRNAVDQGAKLMENGKFEMGQDIKGLTSYISIVWNRLASLGGVSRSRSGKSLIQRGQWYRHQTRGMIKRVFGLPLVGTCTELGASPAGPKCQKWRLCCAKPRASGSGGWGNRCPWTNPDGDL